MDSELGVLSSTSPEAMHRKEGAWALVPRGGHTWPQGISVPSPGLGCELLGHRLVDRGWGWGAKEEGPVPSHRGYCRVGKLMRG